MKHYWVYMLLCWDGSYYVGVTSNLDARLWQHHTAAFPDCYTAIRRPVLLVYSSSFSTPGEAIAAEKRLKGWSRAKKRALIRADWATIQYWSRYGTLPDTEGEIVAHPSTSSG